MRIMFALIAAAVAALCATSVEAAIYDFAFVSGVDNYSFEIDTSHAPIAYAPWTTKLVSTNGLFNGVPTPFNGFSGGVYFDNTSYFSLPTPSSTDLEFAQGPNSPTGPFQIFSGPQLYVGSEKSPMFVPGTYHLTGTVSDFYPLAPDTQLTITGPPPARSLPPER